MISNYEVFISPLMKLFEKCSKTQNCVKMKGGEALMQS